MPITPKLAAWFREVGASGGKAHARNLLQQNDAQQL